MASNLSLVCAALSLSTGGLILADSLLYFSNQNRDNPIILIAVQALLFLLVLCTFISATLLLLCYVAVPQSTTPPFFMDHLVKATRVTALSVLIVGAPLTTYMAIVEAIIPAIVKTAVMGIIAVMILISFNRYIAIAGQTARGIVPAFVALCISTGTLFLIDPVLSFCNKNCDKPLCHVPIHLLAFCNFNLCALLLFLHISIPAHAILMENLVKMALTMSFSTVVTCLFMLFVGII